MKIMCSKIQNNDRKRCWARRVGQDVLPPFGGVDSEEHERHRRNRNTTPPCKVGAPSEYDSLVLYRLCTVCQAQSFYILVR